MDIWSTRASSAAALAAFAALLLGGCDAGAPARQPLPGTIESQRVSPPPTTIAPPIPVPTPTQLKE